MAHAAGTQLKLVYEIEQVRGWLCHTAHPMHGDNMHGDARMAMHASRAIFSYPTGLAPRSLPLSSLLLCSLLLHVCPLNVCPLHFCPLHFGPSLASIAPPHCPALSSPQGLADRAADLSWLSMYPWEEEFALPPLSGVELCCLSDGSVRRTVEGDVVLLHVKATVCMHRTPVAPAQSSEKRISQRRTSCAPGGGCSGRRSSCASTGSSLGSPPNPSASVSMRRLSIQAQSAELVVKAFGTPSKTVGAPGRRSSLFVPR